MVLRTYSLIVGAVMATAACDGGSQDASTQSGSSDGGGGAHGGGGNGPGAIPGVPSPGGCPEIGMDPANTYYICDCGEGAAEGCVAGDDANPGSQESPFKTYEKASITFNELPPGGGTVAFCRGGVFDVPMGQKWANSACKPEAPCVARDYDPDWSDNEELPLPVIKVAAGYGFDIEDGGNANTDGGYRFLNLDLRGNPEKPGFFFYNDVDDVLICGVSIDGFSIGVQVAGQNTPDPDSDGRSTNIVVQNSSITNCPSQGYLGACDGCGVAYTRFENNGFGTAVLNHHIYFGSEKESFGMFAVGNDLYRNTLVNGSCAATSLVVHGMFTDLLIEGNTVREDKGKADLGCWGITADPGHTSAEFFSGLVMRNNTVINMGGVSIGVTACQNCLIENNLVIQEQEAGGVLISVPNKGVAPDDSPLQAITVRNNTLYAKTDGNVTGIKLGEEGTDHSVTNNVFVYEGSGIDSCFDYSGLPDSAYAARNNNVCYGVLGATRWTSTTEDLAAFQSATGHDTDSVVADPLFTSTTEPYDFTPAAGSPLLDAALPGPADDLEGESRGDKPDIGAFERR
ncbi:right-handed parallel beta-helix repeat-containing protein [Sorangium sp. So ce726]|uniref:hypothetical protein n=1 Tax=Sorangium sp. So ce726 TaxID=3133319 RepID=UPI003F63D42C